MNCEQVQPLLLAYLDGEVSPSERTLILAHLSGCTVCQQELDLLSTARSRVRSALQRRAAQAIPSREAWSRLEARLSKMQVSFLPEAVQPSSKFAAWFARKAPGAGHAPSRFFGGVPMQKRWIFSGLAGVIVLSVLAILVAQTATPVSARQVLDRAYEAQSTQEIGEGISHTRVEIYHNLCARPDDTVIATVIDSYFDPQTGYFRTIVTDAQSGSALEVNAFDGAYVYTGHRSVETKGAVPEQGPKPKRVVCDGKSWGDTSEALIVYRGAQSNVASADVSKPEEVQTYREMFDEMRSNPNTELLGEETWLDGRTVYVLRSWQPVKVIIEGNTELPMGWAMSYFDTESYKLMESRATIERDGQEILAYSYRVLIDETLPIGSYQHWDLNDLQGITIVDDTEGQYVDYLPELISAEQLASSTESAYLLTNIPDGFTLEITATPNQPEDQPLIYVASYRTEAGDYFVIQSIGPKEVKLVAEGSDESYTTASGLVLTFMENVKRGTVKQFTSAVIETPEGNAFIINSTLPREQVQTLAEGLTLVNR